MHRQSEPRAGNHQRHTRTRNVSLPTQANHTAQQVCWLDAFTAAWSGIGVGGLPFVARVALLACVGGLTFIVRVCLWWFPALVPACLCLPNHHVSSVCRGHSLQRRSGWACIGNPKLEQESIEGTHARETAAHQRRPTTLHEPQTAIPLHLFPTRQL